MSDNPYLFEVTRVPAKIDGGEMWLSEQPFPHYEHEGDSGMSLYVAKEAVLLPFVPTLIHHGIAIKPPAGCETQIRPRSSSLPGRNLHIVLGTLDAGYRGEIMTSAMYIPIPDLLQMLMKGEISIEEVQKRSLSFDWTPLTIRVGERISQLVVAPVVRASVLPVEKLGESTRGSGGFGSTGV